VSLHRHDSESQRYEKYGTPHAPMRIRQLPLGWGREGGRISSSIGRHSIPSSRQKRSSSTISQTTSASVPGTRRLWGTTKLQ